MARNKFSAECEEEFHDDLIRLQTSDIEPLSLTTHRTSSLTVKRKLFKFVVVSWIYCMSPAAYHRSRISRSLKSITNWFTALHFLPTTRQVRPPNKVDRRYLFLKALFTRKVLTSIRWKLFFIIAACPAVSKIDIRVGRRTTHLALRGLSSACSTCRDCFELLGCWLSVGGCVRGRDSKWMLCMSGEPGESLKLVENVEDVQVNLPVDSPKTPSDDCGSRWFFDLKPGAKL